MTNPLDIIDDALDGRRPLRVWHVIVLAAGVLCLAAIGIGGMVL